MGSDFINNIIDLSGEWKVTLPEAQPQITETAEGYTEKRTSAR